jgi:hypothetical protein
MLFENEIDQKKRVLSWLDETKRICHEIKDTLDHRDYPAAAEIETFFGKTFSIRDGKPMFNAPVSLSVIEAVTALHVAVNEAIEAIAVVMVEDQTAVEMFADKMD